MFYGVLVWFFSLKNFNLIERFPWNKFIQLYYKSSQSCVSEFRNNLCNLRKFHIHTFWCLINYKSQDFRSKPNLRSERKTHLLILKGKGQMEPRLTEMAHELEDSKTIWSKNYVYIGIWIHGLAKHFDEWALTFFNKPSNLPISVATRS